MPLRAGQMGWGSAVRGRPGESRITLKFVIPLHCRNRDSAQGRMFVPWKVKATSAKQSRGGFKFQALKKDEDSAWLVREVRYLPCPLPSLPPSPAAGGSCLGFPPATPLPLWGSPQTCPESSAFTPVSPSSQNSTITCPQGRPRPRRWVTCL